MIFRGEIYSKLPQKYIPSQRSIENHFTNLCSRSAKRLSLPNWTIFKHQPSIRHLPWPLSQIFKTTKQNQNHSKIKMNKINMQKRGKLLQVPIVAAPWDEERGTEHLIEKPLDFTHPLGFLKWKQFKEAPETKSITLIAIDRMVVLQWLAEREVYLLHSGGRLLREKENGEYKESLKSKRRTSWNWKHNNESLQNTHIYIKAH